MSIHATLVAKSRAMCLVIGSLVISYCIAALIAWAGTRYYGDLEVFIEHLRNAAGYMAALRILIYAGLFYLWMKWKRKILLQSDSPAQAKHSALRIELACAATLIGLELTAWQFGVEGAAL